MCKFQIDKLTSSSSAEHRITLAKTIIQKGLSV